LDRSQSRGRFRISELRGVGVTDFDRQQLVSVREVEVPAVAAPGVPVRPVRGGADRRKEIVFLPWTYLCGNPLVGYEWWMTIRKTRQLFSTQCVRSIPRGFFQNEFCIAKIG
jgi:hypothetical protein